MNGQVGCQPGEGIVGLLAPIAELLLFLFLFLFLFLL